MPRQVGEVLKAVLPLRTGLVIVLWTRCRGSVCDLFGLLSPEGTANRNESITPTSKRKRITRIAWEAEGAIMTMGRLRMVRRSCVESSRHGRE